MHRELGVLGHVRHHVADRVELGEAADRLALHHNLEGQHLAKSRCRSTEGELPLVARCSRWVRGRVEFAGRSRGDRGRLQGDCGRSRGDHKEVTGRLQGDRGEIAGRLREIAGGWGR